MRLIFNVSKFFRSTEVSIDTDKRTYTYKGGTEPLFYFAGVHVKTQLPPDVFNEPIFHKSENAPYNYYTLIQDGEDGKIDMHFGYADHLLPTHYLPWSRFSAHKSLYCNAGNKTPVVENTDVDNAAMFAIELNEEFSREFKNPETDAEKVYAVTEAQAEKERVNEFFQIGKVERVSNYIHIVVSDVIHEAIGNTNQHKRKELLVLINLIKPSILTDLNVVKRTSKEYIKKSVFDEHLGVLLSPEYTVGNSSTYNGVFLVATTPQQTLAIKLLRMAGKDPVRFIRAANQLSTESETWKFLNEVMCIDTFKEINKIKLLHVLKEIGNDSK